MKNHTNRVFAAISAVFLLSGNAAANVIVVGEGAATITCEKSCEAFTLGGAPGAPTRQGALSLTAADGYQLASGGLDSEAAALSMLLGSPGAYSSASARRVVVNEVDATTFSTLSRYIALQIAEDTVFLSSASRNRITIEMAGKSNSGAALAHYTEFGNHIPLPPFVWLLALAIVGFFFAGGVRTVRA